MSSASSHLPPKTVVIAGAGIVGLSTAYYLARNHKIPCTVIDPTGSIAPAASGKAAGFLALDWRDGTPLERLCRRSFHLHQEIANVVGAEEIQYRRVTCAFVRLDKKKSRRSSAIKKRARTIEWADLNDASGVEFVGDEESLAQVHPKLLCERLWEATVQSAGDCKLIHGRVVGHAHKDGKLIGAKLEDGSVVEGDALLYACGPWTADRVTGSKAHSVVIPMDQVRQQCIFFTGASDGDFEAFVRPDQTVFCAGFSGGDPDVKVTAERPGAEEPNPRAIQALVDNMQKVAPSSLAPPGPGRACYQPTTPDDLPMMGQLDDPQCYVAVGHSCWGILMAPATGETMANLIATGRKSTSHVSLHPYDPLRFGPLQMVP